MNREEFYQLILTLKDFSKKNRSADRFDEEHFIEVFDQIKPIFHAFPIQLSKFEMYRSRSVLFATDYQNIKQISYPPIEKVRNIGRCNLKGQPMLYGANSVPTTLLEIKLNTNARLCAVVGKFRLKEGESINMLSIGEYDHYRRHQKLRVDAPGIINSMKKKLDALDDYSCLALQFIDSYLADFFRCIPNSKNQRNVYEVTTKVSEAILRSNGVDGLIFPSVWHEGGINSVFNPDIFDSKFEVDRFMLTTPIKSIGYGLFEYFEHATGTRLTKNGDFIWQDGLKFNARATIPYPEKNIPHRAINR
jgi:hypothetical protein